VNPRGGEESSRGAGGAQPATFRHPSTYGPELGYPPDRVTAWLGYNIAMRPLRRLLPYLKPYWPPITLGFLCLVLATPASLFHPLVWMFVVDTVSGRPGGPQPPGP
jgi:hypothetical protein